MKKPSGLPAWIVERVPSRWRPSLPFGLKWPASWALPPLPPFAIRLGQRLDRAIPDFARTTTFKLTVLYSVMIAAFASGLLAYLYYTTIHYIRAESEQRMQVEIEQLAKAYYAGGMERLSQAVFERMTLSGAPFFYYLEDNTGRKIAGHLASLPEAPPASGMSTTVFTYYLEDEEGNRVSRPASGKIVRLRDNGGSLLIAFDSAQQTVIVERIQGTILFALPVALLLSLLGGLLISRGAARRADDLARTAEAVMGGQLGRRVSVRRSGDEFDRLGEHINAMLDKIEKLVESSRHSGDAIAHDLRSPLTRLRNRLEIAISKPMAGHEASVTLEETLQEVDSVLETFNAILRLARLDAGADGELVRLDMSALAEELAELFDPACEEAQLSFSSHVARNLMVLGDKGLLAQALSNLLDNAVKYTPAGGAITFSAARSGDGMIELTVVDSGPGIPVDARGEVIQRFSRLDSARTLPGSGLGLSLVNSVAEMHGGELRLGDGNGPPGRPGLRATLRLPRV